GVDEEELTGAEPTVAPTRDAVVDDGAVRAGPRNGGKGDVPERHLHLLARCAADLFKPGDGPDLVDGTRRHLVEPAKEPCQGDTVAPMRGAAAGNLGFI